VTRLVPALVLAAAALGGLHLMLAALRGAPNGRAPGTAAESGSLDRRRFLLAAGAVTVGAVVGGALTRVYGGLAAAADRAGLRLPRPASPAPPVPEGVEVGVRGVTP
jgi:hypothetical protein